MNNRKIVASLAAFIFFVAKINAQQSANANSSTFFQPVSLFQQFPSSSTCNESSLNTLFESCNEVTLELDNSYSFCGNIISHNKPNPFAETINIRLIDFPDAMLTVSRIRQENGLFRYTGHLLSLKSRDAIVLCQKNRIYYFIKTDQQLVLTE